MQDQQLIEQIVRTQSAMACTRLVDKYKRRVFSFCYRIIKHRESAEEIAQDAFIKALERIKELKDRERFFQWVMKIAYHLSIDFVRKKKVPLDSIESVSVEDTGVDPQAKLIENDRRAMIEMIFKKFPAEEQTVLTLFYLEEQSIKNIEEITGLSLSNVKVKLFRAREILRKELTKIHNLL